MAIVCLWVMKGRLQEAKITRTKLAREQCSKRQQPSHPRYIITYRNGETYRPCSHSPSSQFLVDLPRSPWTKLVPKCIAPPPTQSGVEHNDYYQYSVHAERHPRLKEGPILLPLIIVPKLPQTSEKPPAPYGSLVPEA